MKIRKQTEVGELSDYRHYFWEFYNVEQLNAGICRIYIYPRSIAERNDNWNLTDQLSFDYKKNT